MNSYKQWVIGSKIQFPFAYPVKCSDRFPDVECGIDPQTELPLYKRATLPAPCIWKGEGYIIGVRMAIMSDFKYKKGYQTSGIFGPPEHIAGKSSGKKEMCLLIVLSIKKNTPYLVRFEDALHL